MKLFVGVIIVAIIIFAVLLVLNLIFSLTASAEEGLIPTWIKNTTGFWVDGSVGDSEFISALEFLISQDIIKVSSSDTDALEEKIKNLESENREFKSENTVLEYENKRLSDIIDLKNSREDSVERKTIVEEKIDTSQLTVQELKEQAVSWNYKDIIRNEEYYKGKIIFLTGEIWSVQKSADENENWVKLSVYTGKTSYGSYFEDLMYIWYDGSRLLNDDVIEVYLHVGGTVEKESAFDGSPIYYPIGTARHVTCINC